jgi:hypothetical protein
MEKEGGVDGRDLRGRMIGKRGFWAVSRDMLRVGKGVRGWASGIPRLFSRIWLGAVIYLECIIHSYRPH